jgi:hypothetical protein
MTPHRAKATDFVVEALKLLVTIATLFFGALLAYATSARPVLGSAYYAALILFVACSVLSVMNIHSLVNKLYRGEEDAIMQREAKILNALAAVTLIGGLIAAALFILRPSTPKSPATPADPKIAIISDQQVTIGSEVKTKIRITKDSTGKINEITVEP